MRILPKDKEVKYSTLVNTFAMIVRAVLGAILTIILTRFVPIKEYGYITSVLSFLLIVDAFADLGLGVSVSRFIAQAIANQKDLFLTITSGIILRLVSTIIVFLFLLFGATFISHEILNIPYLSHYIRLASIGFLCGTLYIFFGRILQGLHKPSYNSYAVIADSIGYTSFTILFVLYWHEGLGGVINGLNIGKLFGFLAILILFTKKSNQLSLKLKLNKNSFRIIKKIVKYTIPLFATTLISVVFTQLPILLLSRYSNPENIAYYGISSRIIMILLLPSQAMIYSISTTLTHYKEKSLENLKERISNLYIFLFSLFIPLFIYVLLNSNEIIYFLIKILIKKDEYMAAIPILQILSILLITHATTKISGGILGYIGHPKVEAFSNFIILLVLFTLGTITLIYGNLYLFIIVVIIVSFINATIMTCFLIRKYKFHKNINHKKLIELSTVSLIFLLLSILIKHQFSSLIIIVLNSIIFVVVIVFLNRKYFKII